MNEVLAICLKLFEISFGIAAVFLMISTFRMIRAMGEVAKAKFFLRFDYLHNLHILGVIGVMIVIPVNLLFFNLYAIRQPAEVFLPYGYYTIIFHVLYCLLALMIIRLLGK